MNFQFPAGSFARPHALVCACALVPALLAGSAHAQALQTDFEYDAVNNPTKATDGLKRETVRSYDPLSRLKQITQPLRLRARRGPQSVSRMTASTSCKP